MFEVKGVDKGHYEFVMGSVYDFDFRDFGNFDIVLCLDLLYQVSKPGFAPREDLAGERRHPRHRHEPLVGPGDRTCV